MKALELLKVSDAVGKKNHFSRNRRHLTTMEIGQIVPIFHESLKPGDTINGECGIFARLAPLAVPTYGSFMLKSATFFVDFYQLFSGAESFFSGRTVSRGQNVKLPYFTKSDLLQLFLFSDNSTTVTSPTDSNAYDFCYTISGSTVNYRKLTNRGRYVYKVIRSLGYQIPNIVSTTSAISGAPTANDKLNALPFLAFFKAYNDYMSQSQRFDTSVVSSYLEGVRLGKDVTNWFTASSGRLNYTGMNQLFGYILLQYENDYFTSCWQSPNNPIGNVQGDVTNIALYSSSSVPVLNVNASTENTSVNLSSVVSQRALDFLGAFDAWVRRNNYSGSKDVQKIYSRFGIKPEFYKANYCHLVDVSSQDIQVGDVTSMTDTKTSSNTGAVLGAYAGKGILDAGCSFSYRADDFGMLITLAWITVKPTYSNGYDREVLKTDSLDFYNPEFDGLGGNPVSIGEIFVDRKNSSHTATDENTIFGFNERYCEYKTGNVDQITGDFALFEDLYAWHFDRSDLKALSASSSIVAQNTSFNSVGNSYGANQYNRIFNSEAFEDSAVDHFYLACNFKVDLYSNMKSLNEVPRLGEGNVTVERNGNTIS